MHIKLIPRGKKKIYHMRWSVKGKPQYESTRTSNYTEAQSKRDDKLTELLAASGQPLKKASYKYLSTKWLDHIKSRPKWRTWKRDKVAINHLTRLAPHIDTVQDITPLLLEDFQAQRVGENVLRGTVNRDISAIKAFLTWCHNHNFVNEDAGDKVKYFKFTQSPKRIFTVSEINRIKEAEQDIWKDVLLFGLYTGFRPEELLFLTIGDVDVVNMLISVTPKIADGWEPKDYELRTLELHPILLPVYHRVKPLLKSKYFFSYTESDRIGERPSYGTFCAMNARKVRSLEIRKASLYTCRHTFATDLILQGVPLPAVQKALGHATIETTMKYIHLPPDYIKHNFATRLSYS